jgi:hypothetical protein
MEYISKHFMTDNYDELVLSRSDWTDDEWQAFLDIFGLQDVECIKITEYKLEAYKGNEGE